MGAVYYKYKSGKETFSVPVSDSFISVCELKRLILTSDRYGQGRTRGRGPREDIAISHAQTGEEYADDNALIPQHTTVLIRRTTGQLSESIVVFSSPKVIDDGSIASNKSVVTESASKSCVTTEVQDEDAAITAVIDAAQLKWEEQPCNSRQASGRFTSGHHYGHGSLETPPPGYVCRSCGVPGHFIQHCPQETPPSGYVCHRCQTPGHFIHHCPTIGDPKFDNYKISRSLAPVVSISESPIDGIPSAATPAASVCVGNDLPAELHCQLCNKVMTDAVLTSKCCFHSFCDECIRSYIIKESKCICGVRVLADDLIPNITVRSTISKMLATRATGAISSGGQKSSSGSNCDPKSQGYTPSAALEKEMKQSVDHQQASESLDCGIQVGTEGDIANQPQENLAMNVDLKNKDEGNSADVLKPVDVRESTLKDTTISRTIEPKAAKTDKSKKKIKKSDSTKISQPNVADYGYNGPVGPAYYNPFNNGYPWLTEPYMYGSLGMPYGGYPMGPYGANSMNNMPLQAVARQGYPANYHSWETHPSLHRDSEAVAYPRQVERPKDQHLNSHVTESRKRSRSTPERRGSACPDEENHHSGKRRHVSSSRNGDELSRRRSRHSPMSLPRDTQSRQAERSKEFDPPIRSSARNQHLGSRGTESSSRRERSESDHGRSDRASSGYGADHYSRKRVRPSSSTNGEKQSGQRSRHSSRSLACDDSSDDECNFKRRW